jgi:hypothetical protein
MKARTATVLSVTGVLAAGTAAALANTHVLTSRAESSQAADILLVESSGGALSGGNPSGEQSPGTAPVVVPMSNESGSATGGTPAQATGAVPSESSITSFAVGEAGVVELAINGSVLSVAETTVGSGWKVVGSSPSTASSPATVIFSSPTTEVTFSATLVDGRIVTDVASRSLQPTPPPPGRSHDNDDDHDEDHDQHHDERDGEHHDDDHEDDDD